MKLESFSPTSHPTMPIWQALRITISIPFLFSCCSYRNNFYADGGILCQFPISLLHICNLDAYDEIIGVNLEFEHQENAITDIISYIKALTKTMFAQINKVDFNTFEKTCIIIRILTENLSAFDLDVPTTTRRRLIKEAKEQSLIYLNQDEMVVKRLIKNIFSNVLAKFSSIQ